MLRVPNIYFSLHNTRENYSYSVNLYNDMMYYDFTKTGDLCDSGIFHVLWVSRKYHLVRLKSYISLINIVY